MAFEVLEANLAKGLEVKTIMIIATLDYLITLTPPITESVMRLDLESGQPVVADGRATAFTDDGWLDFVAQLSSITLDLTALTVPERTLINTLRTIVAPAPQSYCCGVVAITEPLVSTASFIQTGFPNFRREFEMKVLGTGTCDMESIDITLVVIGGAPAITSANPFTLTFKQCDGNGSKLMSNVAIEFAGDPATFSYDITVVDPLDADGITLGSFNPAGNWGPL